MRIHIGSDQLSEGHSKDNIEFVSIPNTLYTLVKEFLGSAACLPLVSNKLSQED